jgi:hypothetical protein
MLLQYLNADFALKDLGELHYFLGIEVEKTSSGILMSQEKYIAYVLKSASMMNCKLVNTPMTSLEKISVQPQDAMKYRSLVGALQYITLTRPDISFPINKVCQFLHEPTTTHMIVVNRILRYLRHTLGVGFKIVRSNSTLVSGFADANWTEDIDDRRSSGDSQSSWARI